MDSQAGGSDSTRKAGDSSDHHYYSAQHPTVMVNAIINNGSGISQVSREGESFVVGSYQQLEKEQPQQQQQQHQRKRSVMM
jgi:hypothetical protein